MDFPHSTPVNGIGPGVIKVIREPPKPSRILLAAFFFFGVALVWLIYSNITSTTLVVKKHRLENLEERFSELIHSFERISPSITNIVDIDNITNTTGITRLINIGDLTGIKVLLSDTEDVKITRIATTPIFSAPIIQQEQTATLPPHMTQVASQSLDMASLDSNIQEKFEPYGPKAIISFLRRRCIDDPSHVSK